MVPQIDLQEYTFHLDPYEAIRIDTVYQRVKVCPARQALSDDAHFVPNMQITAGTINLPQFDLKECTLILRLLMSLWSIPERLESTWCHLFYLGPFHLVKLNMQIASGTITLTLSRQRLDGG